MKLVIFGLSISSSWGNGHATLWRGLTGALARLGHRTVFFERDVPYFARHRDGTQFSGVDLVLYRDWPLILSRARKEVESADVAMVTSYCPDALEATALMLDSRVPLRTFYDLDTPVTLHKLESGADIPYIGPRGLADFDVVLSYTGGESLAELKSRLGARHPVALYGSVDPSVHQPVPARAEWACDLSYLGTYSNDRQAAMEALFLEPARRLPERKFLIGGSQYPRDFTWGRNITFLQHVPPADHAAFYSSSKLTLSITRGPMARMGYCPSGRLFEASACGTCIVTDDWEGLDQFFEPGLEIVVARTTGHIMDALAMSAEQRGRIARAGRERTLAHHTAEQRALELERLLQAARLPARTA